MTTAAINSPSIRTVGRLGAWLSVRHSLRMETAGALTLYGLYELARGLVGTDTAQADAHAHRLVALERSLHLFVEANVQRALQTLPRLTNPLGLAYRVLPPPARRAVPPAPPFVLLAIVATGNHFSLAAAAGALVAGLAAALAARLTRRPATARR